MQPKGYLKVFTGTLFTISAFIVFCIFEGCASYGTNGVVQIGQNMYLIGGVGEHAEYSGSTVKARFYTEANKFCSEKKRVMYPVKSRVKDAENWDYASAEIEFMCLLPDDPRLPK